MKTVAIIQARMGSTRLPGKALAEIVGQPAIWHLFRQLSESRYLDSVVLATTKSVQDDPLAAYGVAQGWRVFRGSEHDVLDRYYRAAVDAGCGDGDVIVRVTGDDILVDPEIVDRIVEFYLSHQPAIEHASNNRTPGFPYGADVEVFSFRALEQAWRSATLPEEREHVTPYIRRHQELFPYVELKSPMDYSRVRLSIDCPEDLEFNRRLFAVLYQETQPAFHLKDIIRCIEMHDLKHPVVLMEGRCQ